MKKHRLLKILLVLLLGVPTLLFALAEAHDIVVRSICNYRATQFIKEYDNNLLNPLFNNINSYSLTKRGDFFYYSQVWKQDDSLNAIHGIVDSDMDCILKREYIGDYQSNKNVNKLKFALPLDSLNKLVFDLLISSYKMYDLQTIRFYNNGRGRGTYYRFGWVSYFYSQDNSFDVLRIYPGLKYKGVKGHVHWVKIVNFPSQSP